MSEDLVRQDIIRCIEQNIAFRRDSKIREFSEASFRCLQYAALPPMSSVAHCPECSFRAFRSDASPTLLTAAGCDSLILFPILYQWATTNPLSSPNGLEVNGSNHRRAPFAGNSSTISKKDRMVAPAHFPLPLGLTSQTSTGLWSLFGHVIPIAKPAITYPLASLPVSDYGPLEVAGIDGKLSAALTTSTILKTLTNSRILTNLQNLKISTILTVLIDLRIVTAYLFLRHLTCSCR